MKHGRRKEKRRQTPGTSRAPGASRTSAEAAASSGSAKPTKAAEGSARGPAIEPWWQREAGRLEFELQQLDQAGIKYQIDSVAKARGVLIIDLEGAFSDEGNLHLQARFPDFYPYFRFEIRAPELDLPYHQHPFGKQLCVLGRATGNWNTDETLAAFIQKRVPQVIATSRMNSASEVADLEEHQGEPFSDYYPYYDNSIILIDSSWTLGTANGGSMLIGFPEFRQRGLALRGAVLEIKDENNHTLAKAAPEIHRLFPRTVSCRWIRSEAAIRAGKPELFLDQLYLRDKRLERPNWQTLDGYRYDIIGVVFPEEHRWRSGNSEGWVFATRATPIGGTGGGDRYGFLIRAGRAGRGDVTERTPELSSLRDKKVLVIGAGALGAPSCIEMARCGLGELRILDYDFVDPGTIVRWPLGVSAAGMFKGDAIGNFIASNYPYTKVLRYRHRIGMCREVDEEESEVTKLLELIDGADLIYDASAEIGINHLLSDIAAEHHIPYICVSTTYGAWGGRLIRVRPEGTKGCWMCHQWGVDSGLVPLPPNDPKGEVQPAGCADPTFTGAGFDVAGIALAGVRLAVSTLQSGSANGYPDVDWDIAVISVRNDVGRITVPHWEVLQLERHPECQNFKAHKGNSLASSESFAANSR